MKQLINTILSLAFVLTLSPSQLSAKTNAELAEINFQRGLVNYKRGDLKTALKLMKQAYSQDPAGNIAFNIGLIYDKKESITVAIKWYMQAIDLNSNDASYYYNLARMQVTKKEYLQAISNYKQAISMEHVSAIKNLSYLYRVDLKDKLNGTAYMIALIDKKYKKMKVLNYLRNKLKIDEPTIKKAYKLQQTLVPNPYTGGIN